VIHRHGGDDVTIDHPTTTLEELFLRIVHESDLHPGRRKVAHDLAHQKAPAEGELAGARSKS
jgi:ABC-2 type transport system ATP-binding protein